MEIRYAVSFDTYGKTIYNWNNIVKINLASVRAVSAVFQCRGIQENRLWQPSCAPAKVSHVAAKWRLKNVGLNTHSLFILFDCTGKRQQCNGDSGVKNTSDSFMLLLYTLQKKKKCLHKQINSSDLQSQYEAFQPDSGQFWFKYSILLAVFHVCSLVCLFWLFFFFLQQEIRVGPNKVYSEGDMWAQDGGKQGCGHCKRFF